jgi:predicted cytidylate kinase
MEETEVDLKVPHDPISMIQEIEQFRKTGKRDKRSVNTGNILFIMSGAFGELAPIIQKRLSRQGIGFGARIKKAEEQVDILKKGDVILEGRLSGWLAHQNNIDAVKIMIDADEHIRAERIVNRESGIVKDRLEEMKKRERSERKRYLDYYGVDLKETSIYDLVIDSSEKTPEEIVSLIVSFLSKKGF